MKFFRKIRKSLTHVGKHLYRDCLLHLNHDMELLKIKFSDKLKIVAVSSQPKESPHTYLFPNVFLT